jgi:hypothetical protein
MEKFIAKVNAVLSKLYPSILAGKVPVDKFMHFICGLVIAVLLTPFIGVHSILVVAVVALLKEIYDYLHKDIHTPDFWDWVATVIGGVVGFVVLALLG